MQPAPSLRRTVASARTLTVQDGTRFERADRLAAEEPMEIRVGGPGQDPLSVAVTMRTPGNDFELATGFLSTEGLVGSRTELVSVAYCELPAEEQQYNVVTVRLSQPFDPRALQRNFYATSSCGVCGKASLDQVRTSCPRLGPGPTVARSVIPSLPESLRRSQRIFEETGGLHAAGLFDRAGVLLAAREDVGRHNAVDKLAGWAFLRDSLPLGEQVLMVSGRLSFEIVQKAAMMGVPIVCAVSAPSSLAVETADAVGMTILGFVRGAGFNLYTRPDRIDLDT